MTSKFLQRSNGSNGISGGLGPLLVVKQDCCARSSGRIPRAISEIPYRHCPRRSCVCAIGRAGDRKRRVLGAGSAYGGSGTTRDVVRAGLRQLGERTRKGGGRIASQHTRWGFGGVPAGIGPTSTDFRGSANQGLHSP